MTVPHFIEHFKIKIAPKTFRDLIEQKQEILKNKGIVLIKKNKQRKTYNIVKPDELLQLIS